MARPLSLGVVEALRQHDLVAPALAALPAGLRQEIGGRGQGVGVRAPDVDLAVAVLVDAKTQIVVGHELSLAHGAGPAALQARTRALAVHDDVQGVLQLPLGPFAPATLIGQGGQRADHVVVALNLAEARFLRPDRHQDLGGHSEALGHFPRHAVHTLARLSDAGRRYGVGDVGARRLGELGLVAVQPDHGCVRRHARQFPLIGGAPGAAVPRQEALLPSFEAALIVGLVRRRLRGGSRRRGLVRRRGLWRNLRQGRLGQHGRARRDRADQQKTKGQTHRGQDTVRARLRGSQPRE